MVSRAWLHGKTILGYGHERVELDEVVKTTREVDGRMTNRRVEVRKAIQSLYTPQFMGFIIFPALVKNLRTVKLSVTIFVATITART